LLARRDLKAAPPRGTSNQEPATGRGPFGWPIQLFLFPWVGIWSRRTLLSRSSHMRLLPPTEERRAGAPNDLEILDLSGRHLEYLGQVALEMNPAMPASFSLPHLIRTILDRVEQSGIDLTDASTEEDITRLAVRRLGGMKKTATRRKAARPTASLFASSSTTRRSDRSNLPGTDRPHPGSMPRSGRG
jgi:hypothetical protein